MNYHILHGDLRSGVISKFFISSLERLGVRLRFDAFVAEIDFDFERFLYFYFYLKSISACLLGVLFSF
jgi:hypothetical protein